MSALGASVSHLADAEIGEGLDGAAVLAGAIALFATAWSRRSRGLEPLAPDPRLSHAADTLRLLAGEPYAA